MILILVSVLVPILVYGNIGTSAKSITQTDISILVLD